MTPAERTTRARIAAGRRHHPDDEQTDVLAAAFKTDRLAQYIQQTVDAAPPLSDAQRARLAAVLRPVCLGDVRPTGSQQMASHQSGPH